MRKALLTAVVVTAAVSSTMAASFELGVNAGYGFGMAGDPIANETFKVVESTGNKEYSEHEEMYLSLGKGLKLDINADLFFNDNFGLTVLTGISTLAKYETIHKDETVGEQSETTTNYSASYVPVNLGFKVKTDLGKITPYAYVAPGVAFVLGSQWQRSYVTVDTSYTDKPTELTYAPGFIVSSGLGVQLNLNEKIGIKFEFAPTVGFARLKEYKESYDNGNTYTIKFQKNGILPEYEDDDPKNIVEYKYTWEKTSLSSSAIKIGLQIAF